MTQKVSILDYGAGNILSVVRMFERAGCEAKVICSKAEIFKAAKLVIPGVGSFDHGMINLINRELAPALNFAAFERKIPILGICLGMQLMCNSSEEGTLSGLRWIDASVRRFKFRQGSSLKMPHMGWNTVRVIKKNTIISDESAEQRFYFVHSYHVICNQREDTMALATYGYDFTAAFCRENIYGVQFHPEKSHKFGMALINKFAKL